MKAADALTTVASAALFAAGLAIGGMLDTRNVVGFLDIAGDFDPGLAVLMIGAVGTLGLGRRALGVTGPVGVSHDLRDPKLLAGAVLFGAGWALAGYCPGPALVSLGGGAAGVGAVQALVFVGCMAAGMWIHRAVADATWHRPAVVASPAQPTAPTVDDTAEEDA